MSLSIVRCVCTFFFLFSLGSNLGFSMGGPAAGPRPYIIDHSHVVENDQVNLTWNFQGGLSYKYEVYRSEDGRVTWQKIHEFMDAGSASEFSYHDVDPPAGEVFYRVHRVVNPQGSKLISNWVKLNIIKAPVVADILVEDPYIGFNFVPAVGIYDPAGSPLTFEILECIGDPYYCQDYNIHYQVTQFYISIGPQHVADPMEIQLRYRMTNEAGLSSEAFMILRTINPFNLAPRAEHDYIHTLADGNGATISEKLRMTDYSFSHQFEILRAPEHGTFDVDLSTGEYTFIPGDVPHKTYDYFKWKVTDSGGLSDEAITHIHYRNPAGSSYDDLNGGVLAVYNVNHPDSLEIAEYYMTKRGLNDNQLCPVTAPLGLFVRSKHMLGMRAQIVECICEIIPEEQRPQPCAVGNLDALAQVSPISHLAFIKGVPAQIREFNWPGIATSATSHPYGSTDYYLSYLIYRDVDFSDPRTYFEDGSIDSTWKFGPDVSGDHQMTTRAHFFSEVSPAIHRLAAHGRIEAITKDRTIELIDRTLAAEGKGFTGNVATEALYNHVRMTELMGDDADLCGAYSYVVPFSLTTSLWPFESCRAGTTYLSKQAAEEGGALSGIIPGSPYSTMPVMLNAGLLMGFSADGNNQSGFNNFDTLKNWHKSEVSCTELCSEFPTEAEQLDCRERSTDYFKELNTDCVGTAQGFMGQQHRSYVVQYYGSHPSNWKITSPGSRIVTPSTLDQEPDGNTYFHVGDLKFDDPQVDPLCHNADGSTQLCPQRVTMGLVHYHAFSPSLTLSEGQNSLTFNLSFRHRSRGSVSSQLYYKVTAKNSSQTGYKSGAISLQGPDSGIWKNALSTIVIDSSILSNVTEQGLTQLHVELLLRENDRVEGYFDLDDVSLVHVESGTQLLSPQEMTFDPVPNSLLAEGGAAFNAIDRLGAVAFWGSSAHHYSTGSSFGHTGVDRILAGSSLGEAHFDDNSHSGIVYGDPLYRPYAAKLFFPSEKDRYSHAYIGTKFQSGNLYPVVKGLDINPSNRGRFQRLYFSALQGTHNQGHVSWRITSCPGLDRAQCDADGTWELYTQGFGARHYSGIDWFTHFDGSIPESRTFKLQVSKFGSKPMFSYVYINWDPSVE